MVCNRIMQLMLIVILALASCVESQPKVATISGESEAADVKKEMVVSDKHGHLVNGQFLLLPVATPTLDRSITFSLKYASDAYAHNIKIVDLRSGTVCDAFDHPVWLPEWNWTTYVDENGWALWGDAKILVAAFGEDSNGDRKIDSHDRQSLYSVDLNTGVSKDLLPKEFSYSSKYLNGDELVVTLRRMGDALDLQRRKLSVHAVGVVNKESEEFRLATDALEP